MANLAEAIERTLKQYQEEWYENPPTPEMIGQMVTALQKKYKTTSIKERKDNLVCGAPDYLNPVTPIQYSGRTLQHYLIYNWPSNDGFLGKPESIVLRKNKGLIELVPQMVFLYVHCCLETFRSDF